MPSHYIPVTALIVSGVSFDGVQPISVQLLNDSYMTDSAKVGIMQSKDVRFLNGCWIVAFLPIGSGLGEPTRAPGSSSRSGDGVLVVNEFGKCCAPWMALA